MSHPSEEELDRIDALLMRALDEEASPAERRELLQLADADARLAELSALRDQLRAALRDELSPAGGAVEIVGAVMEALQLDGGWAAISTDLRGVFAAETATFDISDAVMAGVSEAPPTAAAILSALHDGELAPAERVAMAQTLGQDRQAMETLTRYADMGRMIRESIQEERRGVDLDSIWAAVAPAIGLSDPEEIPGWAPVGEALRESVLAHAALTELESSALTEQIMIRLPGRVSAPAEPAVDEPQEQVAPRIWPAWALRLAAPALLLAAALLLVFPSLWQAPATSPDVLESTSPELAQAIVLDDAPAEIDAQGAAADYGEAPVQVESLETAEDVLVQVMQFEDDGPLFLMIDDGASL